MFEFLLGLRRFRKALAKTKLAKVLSLENGNEIVRNAMAYAYEVGSGSGLFEQVHTSAENPFLDHNWRVNIIPGEECQ
jgi:hypothetical protein